MKEGSQKNVVFAVLLFTDQKHGPQKKMKRVVNAFETCSWRRMLKLKWTDRVTNNEVSQMAKYED